MDFLKSLSGCGDVDAEDAHSCGVSGAVADDAAVELIRGILTAAVVDVADYGRGCGMRRLKQCGEGLPAQLTFAANQKGKGRLADEPALFRRVKSEVCLIGSGNDALSADFEGGQG